jgi:hypothetical protein
MTTSSMTMSLLAQDTSKLTLDDIKAIVAEARADARNAALDYMAKYGEPAYCGFSWVNIWGIRGNTKLGKLFKAAGVDQDYTRAFQIWNPSGVGTQSMSVLEAGADAAAKVFTKYGFTAYSGSRAD